MIIENELKFLIFVLLFNITKIFFLISGIRKANTDLAYFLTFTLEMLFYQKMDYIHNNPVAAHIVTDRTYYYYSSSNPMSPLQTDEY
jgi:hypothetical protein